MYVHFHAKIVHVQELWRYFKQRVTAYEEIFGWCLHKADQLKNIYSVGQSSVSMQQIAKLFEIRPIYEPLLSSELHVLNTKPQAN